MEKIKYLWRTYQKEFLVIVCIIAVLLTIGGTVYYENRKKPTETIETVVSIEKKEEEKKVEEVPEPVNEQEKVVNIQVDIKGEVKKPGVYVTSSNSRVIDIITSAGGLTKNADTSLNNLSRKVEDEMVIIIYSKEQVKDFKETKKEDEVVFEKVEESQDIIQNDAALKEEDIVQNAAPPQEETTQNQSPSNPEVENNKSEEPNSKICINTATKEELMTLSGIGESKALAIISYREENGQFLTIEDITKVSGIGPSVFEKIKDFITV